MRVRRFSGTVLKPAKLDGAVVAADGIAGPSLKQETGFAGSLTSAGVKRVLHYDVQTKIGQGGMGVVYKAVDQKLNRLVALKFLPPQIDLSSVDLQRFLQEANALSALNHPHIATIYAVETAGEQQFLVLEYLPGGTLKAKLQQTYSSGAALAIDDVLEYAQQTAEGLVHAHARGIIHRDVKTSNLMLTEEGDVKITDFGVAKLSGSSLRTIPGSLLGTIAYMSPEQALGLDVDARSDAFSFGVVLFELITGRLPFEAPNDAALLTRVANARAPQLRAFRVDAPPELEQIVGKALKKRLEERYGTMGELLADIRETRAHRSNQTRLSTRNEIHAVVLPERTKWGAGVVAAIAVVVLAASFFGLRQLSRAVPAQQASVAKASPDKVSAKQASNRLAVLPFRFVGPEQRNEKLAEEVISVLSNKLIQLEQFHGYLSVSSVADALNEKVTNPKEAIARFGANLALTGAVVEEKDHFIVTVDLLDAQKQIVVNSTEVEGPIDQLPALREALLQRVAEILHTQLREANEARGLCQQGRGYLGRYDRIQNLEIAIPLFEKALQRDPSYAPAHAGRAEAYLRHYDRTTDPLSLKRAEASVAAAMQLNGQLGAAHFAMGLFRAATGDEEGAIESFQRSLQLESGSDAARELANRYDALNRLEAAEATYLQAIQMRRGYWAGYKDLAVFYQKHGRLREALPLFERVAQLAPDDHSSHTNLFAIYFKLRMYSEAAEAMQHAISIDPSALAYYQLGTMFYHAHKYPEAVDAYKKSIQRNPKDGATYGALGDAARFVKGMADVAAEAYENAIALKEGELKTRPRDARLRADIASWLIASDKKSALREIRIALGLNPKDSRVQATAALVYELSGMREKAIASVDQAVKLGHSVEEIQGWPPLEKLRQDPRYKRIVSTSLEGATVKTSSN